MALLQEAYDRGVSAASRKHSGLEGLGFPLLGLREGSEEREQGKDRAKWPPHTDLRPPQIGPDYTSTPDPSDVSRASTNGIGRLSNHKIRYDAVN